VTPAHRQEGGDDQHDEGGHGQNTASVSLDRAS